MKHLALSLISFVLLTPVASFASDDSAIARLLSRVDQSNEPMPATGVFARDRVENIKSRTVQFLTPAEKAIFGLDGSALAFANYRDHGHFYIAYIPDFRVDEQNTPLSASAIVDEVRAIGDHWEEKTSPDLAAVEVHTYLRFLFKAGRGVKLVYDQTTNSKVPTSVPSIDSAVLSIEAIRPKSQPEANFLPYSLAFDFALGHLFYSSFDRSKGEEADPGRIVSEDTLDLSGAESRFPLLHRPHEALLFGAIQASNDLGRSITYNVVTDNCTNDLFRLVDRSIATTTGFNKDLFVKGVKTASDANIVSGVQALRKLAAQKNIQIPPEVDAELVKACNGYLSNELVEGARNSSDPRQYFTWLPIFVNAHFTARGLL